MSDLVAANFLELVRLAQNRTDDLELYAADIRRHLSEGGALDRAESK
jgi:hypothetical protein